jgi:hypothetical protein
MIVRRDFRDWDPAEPLDPEAQGVLDLVDELARAGELAGVPEPVAKIDGYGVVCVDVLLDGKASLYLQAGDGWDRVLWTAASGHTYEWTWRGSAAPGQVRALLDGRGVERTTYLGRRRLVRELVVDGETVSSVGRARRPIARVLRLAARERPAL